MADRRWQTCGGTLPRTVTLYGTGVLIPALRRRLALGSQMTAEVSSRPRRRQDLGGIPCACVPSVGRPFQRHPAQAVGIRPVRVELACGACIHSTTAGIVLSAHYLCTYSALHQAQP